MCFIINCQSACDFTIKRPSSWMKCQAHSSFVRQYIDYRSHEDLQLSCESLFLKRYQQCSDLMRWVFCRWECVTIDNTAAGLCKLVWDGFLHPALLTSLSHRFSTLVQHHVISWYAAFNCCQKYKHISTQINPKKSVRPLVLKIN